MTPDDTSDGDFFLGLLVGMILDLPILAIAFGIGRSFGWFA